MRWGLICACLAMSACASDAVPEPVAKTAVADLTCADFAPVIGPDGVVFNNVWNAHSAGDTPWQQCLIREAGEGRYGWRWDWPEQPAMVFAYPQIRYGVSPWSPDPAFGSDMPIRIADIERFDVSYSLDIVSDGRFNLATSLWLGEGAEPRQEAIRAEVMIWTFYTPATFSPAGKLQGRIEAGGARWEVWLERDWYDVSGVNDNRWTYVTFRATEQSLEAEIDVAALLAYAAGEGYISADWYAYDLETGQELMGGSGQTLVDRFEVVIE